MRQGYKWTKERVAPWTHAVMIGGVIVALASWPHIPAIAWLFNHPEALFGVVVTASRALGIGVSRSVSRVPPFNRSTERDLHVSLDHLHGQVHSVIDSLAYIQAECDTAVEAAMTARGDAQTLSRERE